MNDRTRNIISAGLTLAVLAAVDATMLTAGPGPLFGADPLSAQVKEKAAAAFLEARRAINAEEFEQAVELLKAIRTSTSSHPDSHQYIPDAYYWEAFAYYRLGDLREAVSLLDVLMVGYPQARKMDPGNGNQRGRLYDDAQDLRLRVLGQLGEQGDPRAAEMLLRQSEAVLLPDSAALRAQSDYLEMMAAASAEIARIQVRTHSAFPDSAVMAAASAEIARIQHVIQPGAAVEAVRAYSPLLITQELAIAGIELPDLLIASNPRLQVPGRCEDELVQQAAISALVRLEADRMPFLRIVLERQDDCAANLRRQAVDLIARLGTAEAEKELIDVATNHLDSETRRSAALALRRFLTPSAVDALGSLLIESDDAATRSAAIEALGRIRVNGALETLERFAVDASQPAALREGAVVSLARGDDIGTDVLMRLYGAPGSEGSKPTLLRRLRGKAEAGDDRVTKWLFERAFDKDESIDVRAQALDAWSHGATVDLSRLAATYAQVEESFLRERIFYLLYRRTQSNAENAPEAVQKMIEIARGETDPEVRGTAVHWLGRTGSEAAVEFLLELLRMSPNRSPGTGD